MKALLLSIVVVAMFLARLAVPHKVFLPLIIGPVPPTPTPTVTPTRTATPTTIPTSRPTSLPSPTATSVPGVFVNGDFEAFPPGVGWQQYSSEGRQLVVPGRSLDPPVIPSSGQYLAALKVEVSEARSQIWQDVTLPASGPIYLNWNFLIISKEWCDVPWYDFFTIYVNDTEVFTRWLCWDNTVDSWHSYSLDGSDLAGQTVRILFEMGTLDTGWTTIYLDDISIDSAPR